MSTYYYVVCDACQTLVPFVSLGGIGSARWMAKAKEIVPEFIDRHDEHLNDLHIINEGDPRSYQYREEEITDERRTG